jgi:hypothetical protein
VTPTPTPTPTNTPTITRTPTNTPPPPGPGSYDDTNGNINYTGDWLVYNASGPYNNTLHYSLVVGQSAEFTLLMPVEQ